MWVRVIAGGAAALLLLPVLALFYSISWFLGQSVRFAAFVSVAAVLLVSLLVHDPIYDIPVVAAATLCFLTFSSRVLGVHFAAVVGFLAYAVARRHYGFGPSAILDALVVVCGIAVVWTFICAHSLWIPASPAALTHVEEAIYHHALRTHNPSNDNERTTPAYHMRVVAGIGTVHVPYTGQTTSKKRPLNVVLVHGFAGGNALWAASLFGLAEHFNIYAVEWLGCGRSDRPATNFQTWDEADAFYVQGLEQWRHAMQLDSFVLCGHSMGAMFATHYALRYPTRVEQLVLISPCGIPLPESEPHWLMNALWALEWTPMDLVRNAGPLGPRLMHLILAARLSRQPSTNAIKRGVLDLSMMVEYNYHNWAGKRSGEVGMYTHLLPVRRAYAKRPLKDMLVPTRLTMPISFIYGQDGVDWMNAAHAVKVMQGLTQHTALHKIPSAGHQVFMDNPEVFTTCLRDSIHQAAAATPIFD
ncbi:Aste57867_1364 [Aphanomyces stellatus]|uniref:Aste57867_1364 protein n=1 Tax=Aphanomyces stellatus TaxID=120398 RepID=A0A485KAG4_9STRA|nr:hypothetical protein As57867_001363 [Aphanomyces stellatus]VFT78583.1 Aste57867_1364 [Aphanomyces stellatus]